MIAVTLLCRYDIPDGFYIYGDSAREKDQLEFSKHIIAAVEKAFQDFPVQGVLKVLFMGSFKGSLKGSFEGPCECSFEASLKGFPCG